MLRICVCMCACEDVLAYVCLQVFLIVCVCYVRANESKYITYIIQCVNPVVFGLINPYSAGVPLMGRFKNQTQPNVIIDIYF